MAYLIGFCMSIMISGIAWYKKSLTTSGAIAATVLGGLVFGAGVPSLTIALVAFFVSSSVLSKLSQWMGSAQIAQVEQRLSKTGRRDYTQVLANSGAALMCLIMLILTRNPIYEVAGVISFAAANADTWASEIGVLSHQKPVNLISRKPTDKGISGGVTVLGLVASALGSGFIAVAFICIHWALNCVAPIALFVSPVLNPIYPTQKLLIFGVIISVAGFLGSICDSVLGELWQVKYVEVESNRVTERTKDVKVTYLKGVRWLDNNLVNFISNAIVTLLGLLVSGLV